MARSFARIFFRNAINLGIPIFIAPEIVDQVQDGCDVEFDLENSKLSFLDQTHSLPELPEFARAIMAAGGITNYVKLHGRLPAG